MSLFDSIGSLFHPAPAAPTTPAMRERRVQCSGPHGLHRMAYTEWGARDNPRVAICVHGLTRQGRDFDFLARGLSGHYRVICPDVVGRGRSDWHVVKDDYQLPHYVADMVTLVARLGVEQVHWVGTSMGGLIGMILSSLPNTPVSRLVLNDVGPVVTVESLRGLQTYVGKAPPFADIDAAEAYVRTVSAPFGPLSDAQWRHLTEHEIRPRAAGGVELNYDPGIAEPFSKSPLNGDVEPVGNLRRDSLSDHGNPRRAVRSADAGDLGGNGPARAARPDRRDRRGRSRAGADGRGTDRHRAKLSAGRLGPVHNRSMDRVVTKWLRMQGAPHSEWSLPSQEAQHGSRGHSVTTRRARLVWPTLRCCGALTGITQPAAPRLALWARQDERDHGSIVNRP